MPLLRAQVVLQHVDGLPRDAVSNTFHVTTPDLTAATLSDVAESIRDFYTTNLGTSPIHVGEILSAAISNFNHEVRLYDLDVSTNTSARFPGAPPLHTEVFDLVGRVAAANNMPAEVAVTLSYRNTTVGGVAPARRRGRIYIGPLMDLMKGITAGRVHVIASLPGNLILQAQGLQALLAAGGNTWVVYSRPRAFRPETPRPGKTTLPELPALVGQTYPITQFFSDDAFDTQRRRGERAINRTFSA